MESSLEILAQRTPSPGSRAPAALRRLLLVGAALAPLAMGQAAWAQDKEPEPPVSVTKPDTEAAAEDEAPLDTNDIRVTGSRLRNKVFSSEQPLAVINREVADLVGDATLEEIVRRSPLVTGSQQNDSQQSVVFIGGRANNGGNGVNNISLRGLGVERTLVLLDGKRLTPSGTRGGVSVPDLSIIPSVAIADVEILKDGASSVYGSDAIAGIVNNLVMGPSNDSTLTAIGNLPGDGGAEFFQVAGRFSRIFSGGHINISAQYDRREPLRIGDRDYTDCRDPRLFDPQTGARLDIKDASGNVVCTSFGSNNRFFLLRGGTGNFFNTSSINARFGGLYIPDPAGTIVGPGQAELRAILPEFARVGVQNLGLPPGASVTFGPNSGDFNAVAQSMALLPQTSQIIQDSFALNPIERFSTFISGAIDVSDSVEFYGQALLSRTEQEVSSFRFLYEYLGGTHPSNTAAARVRTATNGALNGSLGFNIHRPFFSKTKTDYAWFVAGMRGQFGDDVPLLGGWDFDVFANYGISDADYTTNFTRQDRLDAVTGFTSLGCDPALINTSLLAAGQTAQSLCASIGGAIPWLSPRVLRDGQLTPEEEAFLEGVETGNTRYQQAVLEGFTSGEVDLPGIGPDLSVALGFHLRYDEIDDVPGPNSQASNNHNFSNGQITRGDSTLTEVFGELGLPLIEDQPFFESLTVNASGRYTKNNRVDDGGAFTYRVGTAWKPVNAILLRANYGTSYRSPALFELFQGGDQSFGAGDPCAELQNSARPANERQNLIQNCGLFGIGLDFQPTVNIRTLNRGNSSGTLRPETSTALNLGIVFQPDFADFAFAVDYFEIRVDDQIGRIGGQAVINRCLVNQAFSSLDELNRNPFCALLGARDVNRNLGEVINGSVNIAQQVSRGIDYTLRYSTDIAQWKLTLNGTATQILEDFLNEDRDIFDPVNDDIDRTLLALRPRWTGEFNAALSRGGFTFAWATTYIGPSDQLDFLVTDPNSGFNPDGTIQLFNEYRFLGPVRPDTRVEAYFAHTASVRYRFGNGLNLIAGVANLFDQDPPEVGASVERVGTAASGPYDFRGRRFFARVTLPF